jgi:DNA-binding beta-propeller fold protein YncE
MTCVTPFRDRALSRVAGLLCGFLALTFLAGCAAKWTMNSEQEGAPLEWPQPPETPRVRYLMSIKGFRETGASLSRTVRSIVYGKGEVDDIIKPIAVSEGADGRIAIADVGDRGVHLFIPKEERYVKIYTAGSRELISPVGVAFDDQLRLYVSDSVLGGIFVYDPNGSFLFSIGKDHFVTLKRPTGLAYDPLNKLIYAVDTLDNKIYAFNSKGETVLAFGERGTRNGQFNFPTYIYSTSGGLLYVTDTMNFRIQVFNSSGYYLFGFGHHGDGSGDFSMPKGIAADKDGIVYVVDSLFDNVQLFDRKGEFLLTIGSRGTDRAEFWLPSGMFIDDNGKLYVCDTFNHRVQVFQIMGSSNE